MKLSFDITDFEVMFNQETEEFYIDLCDFKYALCCEIEFLGTIEPSLKLEFTGELSREEKVLGKDYSLGEFGAEFEEITAWCKRLFRYIRLIWFIRYKWYCRY